MDLSLQLFRLALLGAIDHQITHTIVAGSIFADVRQRCTDFNSRLGQLVTCHLCFGTWVGFLLALVFHPGFVSPDPSRRQPKPVRALVAFLADAFAIALASRFYTEILAILAGRAAVEKEQERLIEEQVKERERAASGEALSRSD
jgi:hypothetical protein